MFLALQKQMMFWTAILVVAVGAIATQLMLEPPPGMKSAKSVKSARRGPPQVLAKGRGPAAVSEAKVSAQVVDDRADLQAVDLTLACKGAQTTSFVKGVAQVRLSGEACQSKREIASTEVRNEANGFSATVFPTGERSFTTDYMTLAHGMNRIRILHVFKAGGREEREYMIDRLSN